MVLQGKMFPACSKVGSTAEVKYNIIYSALFTMQAIHFKSKNNLCVICKYIERTYKEVRRVMGKCVVEFSL